MRQDIKLALSPFGGLTASSSSSASSGRTSVVDRQAALPDAVYGAIAARGVPRAPARKGQRPMHRAGSRDCGVNGRDSYIPNT